MRHLRHAVLVVLLAPWHLALWQAPYRCRQNNDFRPEAQCQTQK